MERSQIKPAEAPAAAVDPLQSIAESLATLTKLAAEQKVLLQELTVQRQPVEGVQGPDGIAEDAQGRRPAKKKREQVAKVTKKCPICGVNHSGSPEKCWRCESKHLPPLGDSELIKMIVNMTEENKVTLIYVKHCFLLTWCCRVWRESTKTSRHFFSNLMAQNTKRLPPSRLVLLRDAKIMVNMAHSR